MFRFFTFLGFFFLSISAFAGGPDQEAPHQGGLCCVSNNENDLPQNQDPKLLGLWTINVDWGCALNGSQKQSLPPETRDWIFKADGSCHDSKGNICAWGAENGRMWVNFINVPIYFRGEYTDEKMFRGQIYNEACEQGCVVSVRANINSPVPTPPEPKPGDQYGYSKPKSSIDESLVGKAYEIAIDRGCTGGGQYEPIIFDADGRCMMNSLVSRSCTWSAYNGQIRIDFSNGLGRGVTRLSGQYWGSQKSGTFDNLSDCSSGCWKMRDYVPPRIQSNPPPVRQPDGTYLPALPPTGQLPPVIYGNPPPIYDPSKPSYSSPW